MQRRKELYWFAVRRCHAGYGLYYLRIQPLYCRYVLLFLCWLPRAVQGNCLLHSRHCRKQCRRYDCSVAEKVIESAALKTKLFLQTQKAYPLQKRIRFFSCKIQQFLLLLITDKGCISCLRVFYLCKGTDDWNDNQRQNHQDCTNINRRCQIQRQRSCGLCQGWEPAKSK